MHVYDRESKQNWVRTLQGSWYGEFVKTNRKTEYPRILHPATDLCFLFQVQLLSAHTPAPSKGGGNPESSPSLMGAPPARGAPGAQGPTGTSRSFYTQGWGEGEGEGEGEDEGEALNAI